ncbi:hypothetical protein B0H13DRAFT_2357800 [Mycena leptocephala]|nr:hypothetical protein B0H13DRAFT_2357800 [Mycena leptocephala]
MTHRHRPFPRKVLSSSAPSQTLHSDRPPTSISFTNGASTAPFLKHRRPRLPQFKSPGSALPLNSPARQRSLHKWRHHDALLGVTSQRHLPRTGGCQSLDPNRPGALPFTTSLGGFQPEVPPLAKPWSITCISLCHFIFPSFLLRRRALLFGGAEKPRARKPSAWVMEEEEISMQALADKEEDAHPDDGAIEIDSDEEYQ